MPMPWTARNPMSIPAFWDSPAAADPSTKITSASWISSFLENRSASLPHSGVDAVIASSDAVTTQV